MLLRYGKHTRTKISKKKGLYFNLRRYKMRLGFFTGLLLFIIAISILPNYIWNINISGNTSIEEDIIINELSKLGVCEGTVKSSIDTKTLPVKLKLQIKDIAWAAINIEGAVANVQLTERVKADIESTEPSNLFASQDGYIVALRVLGGKLNVKLGDTVRKGDILVSGELEYKNGKNELTRSYGEVICRTKDYISVDVDFEQKYIYKTEKVESRKVLSTPFFNLPLFLLPIEYDYQKSVRCSRVEYNNNYLPIKFITANFHEIKESSITIDYETALSMAENELENKEKDQFSNAKIIAKEVKTIKLNKGIRLKAEYICEKNIAIEEKIILGTTN